MRITKLLSLDSEPAKPILDRAKPIALAFLERIKLPETFVVGDQTIENALGEVRPLEVGDVLVDENGGFYKIEAPLETIFKVTGDLDLMQEAVYALTARGVRVAQTEDGFAVAGIEQYKAHARKRGFDSDGCSRTVHSRSVASSSPRRLRLWLRRPSPPS